MGMTDRQSENDNGVWREWGVVDGKGMEGGHDKHEQE